jgi:RND family efflux transporter MFP subunit
MSEHETQKSDDGATSNVRTLSGAATFVICIAIVAAVSAVIYRIYSSEPTASRTSATKTTAMLVDVTRVQRNDFTPTITGLGEVEPARDIVLSPRVSGRVLNIGTNFMPGALVEKGEQLVKIDPSDYKTTIKQRKSTLKQARADLDIELGRKDVAEREYKLMDTQLEAENKALVLREPQLKSARAAVMSAEAELEQAKLELERTSIEAPFHAQVLRRDVNDGSQVAPGQDLGRLVGVDEYWVMVTVPVDRLDRIAFPEDDASQGARVKIRNRTAWPEGTYRTGRVARLIGSVEGKTRMARVLVTVRDPLSLQDDTTGPKMMIGAIVRARITGRKLENVVHINRDYLRDDETVWVMDEGKLDIRDVEIAFKDARHAYISNGLNDGDKVVTSRLATVTEGARLRTSGDGGTEASE